MNDAELRIADRFDALMARRTHYAEVMHEGLRHKMKHLHDDAEQVIDYAKAAMHAGADLSDEMKELEAFGHSLLLMVALLKREGANHAVSEG